MGIEGRHLINFRHGNAQFLPERLQVPRRQAAFAVLDEVQILDEQIPPARAVSQQLRDCVALLIFEQATLGKDRRLAATGTGMNSAVSPAVRHIVHVL